MKSLFLIVGSSLVWMPSVFATPAPTMIPETDPSTTLRTRIYFVNELEKPLTEVFWLTQQTTSPVSVTGVTVVETEMGLQVVLETPAPSPLMPISSLVDGNTLIINLSNAVLVLPDAEGFKAENPIEGIAQLQVVQQSPNEIQIIVTGTERVPGVDLIPDARGLIFNIATEGEIQLVVTGTEATPENPYLSSDATTATKIEAPIRDIPQSIQVIPRQILEDRQVVRLSEVTDNVSGTRPVVGYGGISSNSVFMRGFQLNDTFRNGFRDFSFISPRDVANIERVEILKGPASVLYGNSEPGGLLNTVTKKPLPERHYHLDVSAGSFSFYRATVDISEPLMDDQTLLSRWNFAYENSDSFRDFVENESVFVAPAITWNISPRTRLTAEFEYQNYDYVFDRAFKPELEFLELPRSRFLGEPDFSRAEFDSYYYSYNFEHEFSDDWKIRQGLGILDINGGIQEINLGQLEADRRRIPRTAFKTDESQQNYSLQTELSGRFNTGSVQHNLLMGLEIASYKFAYDFLEASLDSIDIFDPEYGATIENFQPSFAQEYGANTVGLYLQDLAEILPNLKVLGGIRLDWADVFYNDLLTDETFNEFSEFAASPRFGVVYQPSNSTSLYFSWSRSFNPVIFSRSRTNEVFEPETGQQFEVGVKQEFFRGRLAGTLAFFDITKQNVLTTDPEDFNFSVQTGEQKSRGIELDINGEILPGWNVIATYAYTDAFVSEDNTIPEGDQLAGVPRHSGSIWTTYTIQSGNLKGLGLGLGLYLFGEREGLLPNTGFTIPSYFRADASIFYRQSRWRAALNFKNIFNEKYYETQGFLVYPQAPFTVLGSLAIEF